MYPQGNLFSQSPYMILVVRGDWKATRGVLAKTVDARLVLWPSLPHKAVHLGKELLPNPFPVLSSQVQLGTSPCAYPFQCLSHGWFHLSLQRSKEAGKSSMITLLGQFHPGRAPCTLGETSAYLGEGS